MKHVSVHHLVFLGSLTLLFSSSLVIGFGVSDNLSGSDVFREERIEKLQTKQEKETNSRYYKVVFKSEEGFDGETMISLDGISVNASELVKAVEQWLKNADFSGIPEQTAKAIRDVLPGAILSYSEKGIFPSVTVFQYILESGHGLSDLASKYNNGFGIKADSGWSGKKVMMWTSEDYGSGLVQIQDYFRVYDNLADSIVDHADFLDDRKINGRYTQAGVFNAKNGLEQIACIKAAGYATDPDYPAKYSGMCADYDLLKYDKLAEELLKKLSQNNQGNGSWKPDGSMGWMEQYNINKNNLTVERAKLLAMGHSLLGTPYVWGGDSAPDKDSKGNWVIGSGGFDCSSFVRFVYQQVLGIDITRSTYTQVANPNVKQISASEAKPGDLVYDFTSEGSPEHVGIYLGQGSSPGAVYLMHAPQPGEVVKIGNYPPQNSYIAFYRVVGVK